MFRIRVIFSTTLLAAALLAPLHVSAQSKPFRKSSGNGNNSIANLWNLIGRTASKVQTAGTKKVAFTRQYVCINQDVEDGLPSPNPLRTGTCDSGQYLYLFQFTSASANVKITIAQLANFTPDSKKNNYGVMLCDGTDPLNDNTTQICTTDPNDPNLNNIPAITVAGSTDKTSVSFTVPNFPTYAPGVDNQGQGLTLYVLTDKPLTPGPIRLLQVGIQ
jgi:hypothetical protein